MEHGLPEAGDGQNDDDNTVDDHQAHGLRPGQPFSHDQGDSNQGVDAQPGREAERVFCNYPEQDGHDSSRQCGHGSDLWNAQDRAFCIFRGA